MKPLPTKSQLSRSRKKVLNFEKIASTKAFKAVNEHKNQIAAIGIIALGAAMLYKAFRSPKHA